MKLMESDAPFMNLYLLRHGESLAQTGESPEYDPGLSVRGREQACKAGRAWRELTFDFVYVSPLRRARETYELLDASVKHPALFEPALEELSSLQSPNDHRMRELRRIAFRHAEDGARNVLFVSHSYCMSAFLNDLLTGDSLNSRVYMRLNNVHAGLLKLSRVPEEHFGVCAGWNLKPAEAMSFGKDVYP